MSEAIVIVAVPPDFDQVWRVSSEKVPHMTLLYLDGDTFRSDEQSCVEFIQHAVSNSSIKGHEFLEVKKRGELGEDKADVLFFEKNAWLKSFLEFRTHLLTHPTISEAFNKVDQYPDWTPHLTLGYPESPARPGDPLYGSQMVSFDRIQVWTGDYEGPSFDIPSVPILETEVTMSGMNDGIKHAEPTLDEVMAGMTEDQRDLVYIMVGAGPEEGFTDDELSGISDIYETMSEDQISVMEFVVGAAEGIEHSLEYTDLEDYLEHSGVKGMRWGVRKDRDSGPRSLAKEVFANGQRSGRAQIRNSQAKVKAGNANLRTQHIAKLKTRGRRTANFIFGDKQAWIRVAAIVGISAAAAATIAFAPGLVGVGALGTASNNAALGGVLAAYQKANLVNAGVNAVRVVRNNAKVSMDYEKMASSIRRARSNGAQKISNLGSKNKTLRQSGMDVGDYIQHYGRLGMRWGYRRATNSNGIVVGEAKKTGGRSKGSDRGSVDHEKAVKALVKRSDKGTKALSTDQIKSLQKRIQAAKDLDKTLEEKSDLQKAVDKLRLEADYAKLSAEAKARNRSALSKFVSKASSKAADAAVEALAKNASSRIDDYLKAATGTKNPPGKEAVVSKIVQKQKQTDGYKDAQKKARKDRSNRVHNITSLGR